MIKKIAISLIFILIFQTISAQVEYITVWKPSNVQTTPLQTGGVSTDTQIWFPIKGNNFTINWEEIGYPSHSQTLNNVSSNLTTLIDFGTPLNPDPTKATYRIKITGNYTNVRFMDSDLYPQTPAIVGDTSKILYVEQWGKNQWATMREAYSECGNLDILATDIPDLSNVTDMSSMFSLCMKLIGNSTINNWNISNVTDISKIFFACNLFNQPLGNWNTSNVTNMGNVFSFCIIFNQPIATWNTSKVTDTSSMFFSTGAFNQPIGNWDVSKVTTAQFMFFMAQAFNQPIENWNMSNLVTAEYMFANTSNFNQNIGNWNVSNIERAEAMFQNSISFNQSLENWNLQSLLTAPSMLSNTGINCENYSKTLRGWAINTNTPNNINIGSVFPAVYSGDVSIHRNNLISKGWTITGDVLGECSILSTSNIDLNNSTSSIYPNPATDFIYIKNLKGLNSYKIFDLSGRVILQNALNENKIDIKSLSKGNYILQIITKENTQNFKFIKK
jgi:surface protein